MRLTANFRSPKRIPLLQVAKTAIATVLAWVVASILVPGPAPLFAAIAAVLVVQPSVNQSLTKAMERSVGVIVGVAIASALGLALGDASWVALLASVVALGVAWLLKMTATTTNQVAISALLVLVLGTGTPGYALNRILETIIGALIGIVINVIVVPPVAVVPAQKAVFTVGTSLADVMDRLAGALERPLSYPEMADLLTDARQVRPLQHTAVEAIGTAAETLTINPRGRRHREHLIRVQASLDQLTPVVTQIIGMTRALADHYDPSVTEEPLVRDIAEQLRRAAHDTRDLVRGTESAPPNPLTPALTSQLTITAPSAQHWVLLGSMLEDLRRIHLELTEPPSAPH